MQCCRTTSRLNSTFFTLSLSDYYLPSATASSSDRGEPTSYSSGLIGLSNIPVAAGLCTVALEQVAPGLALTTLHQTLACRGSHLPGRRCIRGAYVGESPISLDEEEGDADELTCAASGLPQDSSNQCLCRVSLWWK